MIFFSHPNSTIVHKMKLDAHDFFFHIQIHIFPNYCA